MTNLKYIYIDESGDLGIKGSKYLILSALIVDEIAPLDRIIKNMRRHKFKKELRKAGEIKANKSSIEVKKHMLHELNSIKSAKITYVVLEKKKIYSEFLKNNKHKLYNYVAGKLAVQMNVECYKVEIRIDKSKGKQLLQEDFNKYFIELLMKTSKTNKCEVFHSYSQSWSGIQFADMLAWACFQKFEHNKNEFIDLIRLPQEVYHIW